MEYCEECNGESSELYETDDMVKLCAMCVALVEPWRISKDSPVEVNTNVTAKCSVCKEKWNEGGEPRKAVR